MASIVFNKARGTWVVYWLAGGRRRGKSFPKDRKREANAYAAKVEAEKASIGDACDLQTAAVYWCEDRRATCEPRTYERYRSVITQFAEEIGPETPLHKITPHQIAEWRNQRLTFRARTTVRNDIKTVIAFFRWCRTRRWLDQLPTDGVKPPTVKRTVPEHLPPTELEALLTDLRDNAPAEYYLLAVLAADAGLRRNEAIYLRWQSIDFQNRHLTITGKSKDPRIVPMTKRLETLLLDWPQAGPFLFPAKYSSDRNTRSPDLAYRLNEWLHARGQRITLHGLRHSFAVRLVSRGASERAVGDLLGHQDLATVRIYARSHLDYLRQIVDAPDAAPHPTNPHQKPATASAKTSQTEAPHEPIAPERPASWPQTSDDITHRAKARPRPTP